MIKVWELLVYVIGSEIAYFVCRYLEEKIHRPEWFKNWKAWKRHNTNNPIYKLFVLFGWSHSPTFEIWGNISDKVTEIERGKGWRCKFHDNKPKKEKTDEQL